jgi:hypothetical protein
VPHVEQELLYPSGAPEFTIKLYDFIFQIYVEYVVRNPVCDLDKPITSELFQTKIDEFVRGLPFFASKIS